MFSITPSECYENNPRSILESFAMGKPVLGSNIGGIPELVIDGKTGFTFKVGDSSDLNKKIRLLLSNNDKIKNYGINARELIEEKFNSDNYYYKLIDIYNNTIK